MNLPAHIADRVAEALAALHRHPERALLPWYRYAIYAALADGDSVRGMAVRARLDVAAARKALFCWQPFARRRWRGDWIQPDDLLATAERLLTGAEARAEALVRLDRAHALADIAGEPATSPHYCSWCVFEAALRALGSAWACAQLACAAAPAGDEILGTDDASAYAAIAVGGGAWRRAALAAREDAAVGRWDWRTEDAQLRRAVFWEWWLRDAVPAAWRML